MATPGLADFQQGGRRLEGMAGPRRRRENSAAFAARPSNCAGRSRNWRTLAFDPDQWQELQADHARLSHAATLLEGAEYGLDLLNLDEGDMAVLSNSAACPPGGLVECDTA